MNTDKIVKQFEEAMETYHDDMKEFKSAMAEFNEEQKKCKKAKAKLVKIRMNICDPKEDRNANVSFLISRTGYKKMEKAYDKHRSVLEWPVEPVEPFKPTLEVRTQSPKLDNDIPF